MRKIERSVYNYSELADRAKEEAYYSWLQNADYPWHCENAASIVDFADALGFSKDESNDIYCFMELFTDTFQERQRGNGKRFVKNIVEKDHQISSYWIGAGIIYTLRQHMNVHPFDLKAAVIDVLEGAERAIQQDIDDYYSEESFAECCSANDWEFFADGTQYYAE